MSSTHKCGVAAYPVALEDEARTRMNSGFPLSKLVKFCPSLPNSGCDGGVGNLDVLEGEHRIYHSRDITS